MAGRKDIWIIQAMTLLHALVALCFRLVGQSDELTLTILTMVLCLVLCMLHNASAWRMTVVLILANVAGYFLSHPVSVFIRDHIVSNRLFTGPLTTAVITEVIGFCTMFYMVCPKRRKESNGLYGRIGLTALCIVFIIIIIGRFILYSKRTQLGIPDKALANMVTTYVVSCLAVFIMSHLSLRLSTKAEEEHKKANTSQYRYHKLKEHVEPHFMFNSLNSLDGLVCEQKNEAASLFISRLSSVYRYMIDKESESLVSLWEEVDFVDEYVELMKIRFDDTFSVEMNIPENFSTCKVVPCAIQMLIENALKHNVASSEKPLRICIYEENGYIVVKNNLQPKNSAIESTKLGLRYIQQEYADLGEKEISILQSDDAFEVRMPLLRM